MLPTCFPQSPASSPTDKSVHTKNPTDIKLHVIIMKFLKSSQDWISFFSSWVSELSVCSFVDRKCSTLKICAGFVLFVLFNPLCALKTVFTKTLLVCVKSVVVVSFPFFFFSFFLKNQHIRGLISTHTNTNTKTKTKKKVLKFSSCYCSFRNDTA